MRAEELGSRRDGGVWLTTDRVLTMGACLLHEQVQMYTLHAMLVGSLTDTSTSPPGRSLKRQRRVCWKGRPRRRLKFVFLTMCTWTWKGTLLTCMVRNSTHPTVQFVAPFAPSISMVHCMFIGTLRALTKSHQMTMICEPVSNMAMTLMSLLIVTSNSCKGRQKAGLCSGVST